METLFEDRSPIQSATLLDRSGCSWLIEKEHSIWILESPFDNPAYYSLRRLKFTLEKEMAQLQRTEYILVVH